jgi:ABC-type transporter Mla MlaB component
VATNGGAMLTWTIDNSKKKSRRREITVNLEGKLTSHDCVRIFTLCFDNSSRCAQLVLDISQVEETDSSMPVLICCLSRTPDFAAGRVSLRKIPPRQSAPVTVFMGTPESTANGCLDDHPCSVSLLAYGAPPFGTWPEDTP